MKREKRKAEIKKKTSSKKVIILWTILVIVLILLFILLKNLALTTKVIEKPPTPENCSNESIKKAWEFIFKGSSENLTIFAPTTNYSNETNYSEYELVGLFNLSGCPVYSVYQVNGTKIKALVGVDTWFLVSIKMIYAINGNFKPEAIENITSSLQNTSGVFIEILSNSIMGFEGDNSSLIPRNITTIEEAKSQFESVFKITSSNWTSESSDSEYPNLTLYIFNESEEMENMTLFGESINPMGEVIKVGMIFGNSSLDEYIYTEMSMLSILKSLGKQFENWTSPINTSVKNITIDVNNSRLRMSEEWGLFSESRSGIQKVKILEKNKTIIETEVNFSNDFDWTKIILKKQDINSTRGYVIINGLNYTKNVTVDRLNNESESVCIKDKQVNSISEISGECNSTSEYLLDCPEKVSKNITNLTCKISGGKFIITGLTHSAIIEMLPPEEPCIQNWTCTDWTDYKKSCGYRTCADSNSCNNETTRPIEYKECPVCIPNWDCTNFVPEKCPKSEKRTKTCTDLNNCGTSQGEPSLTQTCKRNNNWIWIIIGAILMILILIMIILFSRKNKKQPENPPKQIPTNTPQKDYKEHPIYPSKLEQQYSSDKTYDLEPPINPDSEKNPKEDYKQTS